jgi:hypothetical protein
VKSCQARLNKEPPPAARAERRDCIKDPNKVGRRVRPIPVDILTELSHTLHEIFDPVRHARSHTRREHVQRHAHKRFQPLPLQYREVGSTPCCRIRIQSFAILNLLVDPRRLGAKYLARKHASVLAVIGSGGMARSYTEAMDGLGRVGPYRRSSARWARGRDSS